jgi:phosphotransferase system HPr (HPr) family protein
MFKRRRPEDDTVASRPVTIMNPLGLHARPAAEFAKAARAFRAEVWLVKDGTRFSAASLIEILRANLLQGATATIEAKGRDAEEAVKRLAQLVREFRD